MSSFPRYLNIKYFQISFIVFKYEINNHGLRLLSSIVPKITFLQFSLGHFNGLGV